MAHTRLPTGVANDAECCCYASKASPWPVTGTLAKSTMGAMNSNEILADLAQRPVDAVKALPDLSAEQLNAHPAGHPNSIAWLLWHSGREIDVQHVSLTGSRQQWEDFRERFALGELGDSIGFGHTSEQAGEIRVDSQQLLVEYFEATITALRDYMEGLSESDLDEIIDENWTPPVTRGVRLISIINDAIQHVGQAAYAAGALTK